MIFEFGLNFVSAAAAKDAAICAPCRNLAAPATAPAGGKKGAAIVAAKAAALRTPLTSGDTIKSMSEFSTNKLLCIRTSSNICCLDFFIYLPYLLQFLDVARSSVSCVRLGKPFFILVISFPQSPLVFLSGVRVESLNISTKAGIDLMVFFPHFTQPTDSGFFLFETDKNSSN
jgi:hypothetical protein